MNNKYLKSILQNRAEQIAPGSEIDLWPSIQKHFTSHRAVLLTRQGRSKMKGIKQNVKVIVPIVSALFLVAALVAFTPQGRVLADTVIRFFTIADQSSFPVPTSQPPTSTTEVSPYLLELVTVQMSSISDTTSGDVEQNCDGAALLTYACQVARAEIQAGFDAMEFPADPLGVAFGNVEVNPVQGEIKITYEVVGGGGWIELLQGIGNISDGLWGRVPAEAVEAVLIGDLPGEYVRGRFTSNNSGEATWNPEAATQRLRWQNGEHWFSIEKNGDPYPIEYLGREEMIALAASLVDRPQQRGSQLRAEYLTSITDAEILSGIDLIEPTLLPMGFNYSFAQYDTQAHSVRLVFNLPGQPDEAELIITETPLEYAEQPDEGYYESEDYKALSWIKNDLYITIIFTSSRAFSGQLDEASMTSIAESMR